MHGSARLAIHSSVSGCVQRCMWDVIDSRNLELQHVILSILQEVDGKFLVFERFI
jgi:hypothetical protein